MCTMVQTYARKGSAAFQGSVQLRQVLDYVLVALRLVAKVPMDKPAKVAG